MKHRTCWFAAVLLTLGVCVAAQAQTYDLREMYRDNQLLQVGTEMELEVTFTPAAQEGEQAAAPMAFSGQTKTVLRARMLATENGDPRALRVVVQSGEDITSATGAEPQTKQCPYIGKVVNITRTPGEPDAYSDAGDAAIEDPEVAQWVSGLPSQLFPPNLEKLAAVSVGDRWEVPAKNEDEPPAKGCLVGITEEDGRRLATVELEIPAGGPDTEPLKGVCLFDLDAHFPATTEIGGENEGQIEADGTVVGRQAMKMRMKLTVQEVAE